MTPELLWMIFVYNPGAMGIMRLVCNHWYACTRGRKAIDWKHCPRSVSGVKWAWKSGGKELVQKNIYRHVAAVGDLPLLKFLWKNHSCNHWATVIDLAAGGGHWYVVQFLYTRGCPLTDNGLRLAISNGRMKVIRFFLNNRYEMITDACRVAACNGQLGALKFLVRRGFKIGASSWVSAVQGGHLKVLQYLHTNELTERTSSTCNRAMKCGHFHVVRWAHANGFRLKAGALMYAAGKCDTVAMAWVVARGRAWHPDVCSHAALFGKFENLVYARDNGCEWDARTTQYAAIRGHTAVFKYAHQHGCPLDAGVWAAAAYNGHLEILQYAHEVGCLSGDTICDNAARRGHLEVVQWAHGLGYPCELLNYATLALHENVREWARSTLDKT
jgi:hypothetical protein